MTVRELIEQLQALPPDLRVMVPYGEMPEYLDLTVPALRERWVVPHDDWAPNIYAEKNDGERVVVIG